MISVVKAFPQPLKGLYLASLVFFAVWFMGLTMKANAVWPLVPLGVSVFLMGLCLSTNFNKCADGVATIVKGFRKPGVEYRKPPLENPVFLRAFGALPMVFGLLFFLAGLS